MGRREKTCEVVECNKKAFQRGYCVSHEKQFYQPTHGGKSKRGADDMIMLANITQKGIADNLKTRHAQDIIYSCIGPVLVVMNPYKWLQIYTETHIEQYSKKHTHELPPHVYGVAQTAYRDMLEEEDNQCVIISGESGAGKTEASKQVMSYISAVSPSGQGGGVEQVKRIILGSNPLLEAFGNAKTLRNNNSSRFGKYFEIQFNNRGMPQGGYITNYLLEKSRLVQIRKGERNFHIFYQLLVGGGASSSIKKQLKLKSPEEYRYLNQSETYDVDTIDDGKDWEETRKAMKVIGMKGKEQQAIFALLSALLLVGNIRFKDKGGSSGGVTSSNSDVAEAAEMLGVDQGALKQSLSCRRVVTAGEQLDIPNNKEQAQTTRDALMKGVYFRLFDWLVKRVNNAMESIDVEDDWSANILSIAVLDIYGFEIFQKNGYEQFCINFVNEKLQQIFIELTLKSEQDEYAAEGIAWKPIPFFNNKVVCDLIEGKRPPGMLSVLDDVCATMHAESTNVHVAYCGKLSVHSSHPHFMGATSGFTIKHYAGDVRYDAGDFPEKNKDTLYKDVVRVLKSSTSKLLTHLFESDDPDDDSRGRPTTTGFKIRAQTKVLVNNLMACSPHYVRCIKSNDNKAANQFDAKRVQHQIQYLGLVENIKVRRAGFAYRQEFYKFTERFKLLSHKTWPDLFTGSDKGACKAVLKSVSKTLKLDKKEVQMGKTKLFIKNPETIHQLDELKEQKISDLVMRIQRAWRRYQTNREFIMLRRRMQKELSGKKERRRESLLRPFQGDYLKVKRHSHLKAVVESLHKKERVLFSDQVKKLTLSVRDSRMTWDDVLFVLTNKKMYFVQKLTSHDYVAPEDNTHWALGCFADIKDDDSLLNNDHSANSRSSSQYVLRSTVDLDAVGRMSMSSLADNMVVFSVPASQQHSEPAQWVDDKSSKECNLCKRSFGVFHNRRHHCRLCGHLFCQRCSSKAQVVPAFGMFEPARVCDSCFGVEPFEPQQDIVIDCDKKTELLATLQDAYKSATKRNLDVSFDDNIQYNLTVGAGQQHSASMKFDKAKKAKRVKTSLSDSSSVSVTVPPGLPKELVERQRRNEAKRRKMAEQRRKEEGALRAERAKVREAERERVRKQRLKEKKQRKMELIRKRQEEEKSQNFRSSRSTPKAKKAAQEVSSVPCSQCSCTSFTPNPFKKHQCNSCFHKH